jgi:hypothetical protein
MKRANWMYLIATALVLSTGITVAGARTRHFDRLSSSGSGITTDAKGHGNGWFRHHDSSTTVVTTTTVPPTTTTTTHVTTTTATTTTNAAPIDDPTPPPPPPAGAFMSYPLQACTTSISGGTNIEVSNKSWRDCRGQSAIVVSGAHNVYLHDLDFDSNSGDIFLINDTGNIRVENIRARNTGAGRTTNGSGQGEVIQLNNTWQSATDDGVNGIRNIRSYGGNTEDQISIFQSGGVDASHPLVIEDNHIESPMPGSPLAWSSGSGTCINTGDAGGHDIIVRNNTVMSCGQAGIIINEGSRVHILNNIIYGAARASSNVGLTQWSASACTCSGDEMRGNRIWWAKADGTPAPFWLSGNAIISTSGNVMQDPTIDPNTLHVAL